MTSKIISYYSTNLKSPEVSFKEALLAGLAPDGGLYLPSSLPFITPDEIERFAGEDYQAIAFSIISKFLAKDIDEEVLYRICNEAYNFQVPLEKVFDRRYILRLDQGPTASFKDFAARVMSRLMQHYLSLDNRYVTILTATSGDTGSAVASAFYGLKNINVIILFPEKEVSVMQRKQMTTLDQNINVIAINGKFDDCQKLVKTAFLDPDLSDIPLSSANSINIGRLLPQSVYYYYSYAKLATNTSEKVIFSVPSGNFGNVMGGLLAKRSGLPVSKFVISTNENDEVPEYLKSGIYKPVNPSKNCISSAMNVGQPSNLARIITMYGGMMDNSGNIIKEPDLSEMRNDFFGISVTDEETRQTINETYKKYNLLLEPHGAVAWKGLKEYLNSDIISGKPLCIALETAHPSKFGGELKEILNIFPSLPPSLTGLDEKAENFILMENGYEALKNYIIKRIKK
jgi:threonine synthase